MILVRKSDNLVILSRNTIEVLSDHILLDGVRYSSENANTSSAYDTNIPFGEPKHWKYINGELILTEDGNAYKAELENEAFMKEKEKYLRAISNYLDSVAQSYGYDDMKSARSYAGFVNAFQSEAVKLGQWASECWVYAETAEAEALSGIREIPTAEVLISEFPELVI